MAVRRQASVPGRDNITGETSPATAGSFVLASGDPLDYFGAIRDLVEQGLSTNGTDVLSSIGEREQRAILPAYHARVKREKTELEQKVATLERTIAESREHRTLVS